MHLNHSERDKQNIEKQVLHKRLSVQLIILASHIKQRKYVRPIRGYRKKNNEKTCGLWLNL